MASAVEHAQYARERNSSTNRFANDRLERRWCSGGGQLVDRHVLCAVARERLTCPVAPSLAQAEVGQLGHEVEFRRPDEAEGDSPILQRAADGAAVARH